MGTQPKLEQHRPLLGVKSGCLFRPRLRNASHERAAELFLKAQPWAIDRAETDKQDAQTGDRDAKTARKACEPFQAPPGALVCL